MFEVVETDFPAGVHTVTVVASEEDTSAEYMLTFSITSPTLQGSSSCGYIASVCVRACVCS